LLGNSGQYLGCEGEGSCCVGVDTIGRDGQDGEDLPEFGDSFGVSGAGLLQSLRNGLRPVERGNNETVNSLVR
jgi:hypothetical protein